MKGYLDPPQQTYQTTIKQLLRGQQVLWNQHQTTSTWKMSIKPTHINTIQNQKNI